MKIFHFFDILLRDRDAICVPDTILSSELARHIAALLNIGGGHILLGVEDNRTIVGLVRHPDEVKDWVMQTTQNRVWPSIIPQWQTFDFGDKTIGIVTLFPVGMQKPYKAKYRRDWITQIRSGNITRDASDEEEARLYFRFAYGPGYDRKPALGAKLVDLDMRRLINYFCGIRMQDCPPIENSDAWNRFLVNTGMAVETQIGIIPTIGSLLLFGLCPNKYLPQAGIVVNGCSIRGPIVPLLKKYSADIDIIENGLIEQAIDFIRQRIDVQWFDNIQYAIHEAILNAIAHRDYTIADCRIEIVVCPDYVQIMSPGRLPDLMTIEKLRMGCRIARNEFIRDVLRDYYSNETNHGMVRKLIKAANTEFSEQDNTFIVKIFRKAYGDDTNVTHK